MAKRPAKKAPVKATKKSSKPAATKAAAKKLSKPSKPSKALSKSTAKKLPVKNAAAKSAPKKPTSKLAAKFAPKTVAKPARAKSGPSVAAQVSKAGPAKKKKSAMKVPTNVADKEARIHIASMKSGLGTTSARETAGSAPRVSKPEAAAGWLDRGSAPTAFASVQPQRDGEPRADDSIGEEFSTPVAPARRELRPHDVDRAKALAIELARCCRDDKCEDVLLLDVTAIRQDVDFIVIASGSSDRQMRSVLHHLEELANKIGNPVVRTSADDRATWLLSDFMDVVVHLFEPNTRAHYNLEMHFADAPKIAWERDDQRERDMAGIIGKRTS